MCILEEYLSIIYYIKFYILFADIYLYIHVRVLLCVCMLIFIHIWISYIVSMHLTLLYMMAIFTRELSLKKQT